MPAWLSNTHVVGPLTLICKCIDTLHTATSNSVTVRAYNQSIQTSDHKSTSPGFLRQLTTCHCSQLLLSAGRAAIDQYLLLAGPTAANPPQQSTAAE